MGAKWEQSGLRHDAWGRDGCSRLLTLRSMRLVEAQASGGLQGKFTCKQEPGSGGPAGAMGEGLWLRGDACLREEVRGFRSLGGRREVTCAVREEKFRAQGTQVPGEGPTWAVTQHDGHTVQVGLLASWLLVKCVPGVLGSI